MILETIPSLWTRSYVSYLCLWICTCLILIPLSLLGFPLWQEVWVQICSPQFPHCLKVTVCICRWQKVFFDLSTPGPSFSGGDSFPVRGDTPVLLTSFIGGDSADFFPLEFSVRGSLSHLIVFLHWILVAPVWIWILSIPVKTFSGSGLRNLTLSPVKLLCASFHTPSLIFLCFLFLARTLFESSIKEKNDMELE